MTTIRPSFPPASFVRASLLRAPRPSTATIVGPAVPPSAPLRRRLLGALAGTALSGCAALPVEAPDRIVDAPVRRALAEADVVLLGEVHDNAGQHARRVAWLREALAGRRVVLAMEQFDVDRQADLDAGLAAGLAPRALAERAGFSFEGWNWDLYAPAVALAQTRGWPLVAANLPAREAMAAARGPGAAAVPPGWDAAADATMAEEIRRGHCDLLPVAMVPAIAAAQRARDARMARAVADARSATGLPVVLLAGNGHVRRDVGVPRWLAALRPGDRVVSVGLVESAAGNATAREPYDLVVRTEAVERPDPCESLKQRMSGKR